MKKEEFITKLRKNLSVLEEKEIQDIVEEYEQHIDMKMKGGLSEEDAIHDFGDLKELTAGILEAYHVKADYHAEKKNIDFEKVKEESRKATEKATSALGKGAGAAGKWGIQGIKKLWSGIKKPCVRLKERLHAGRKESQKYGFFGKLWMLVAGCCGLIWHFIRWCVRLCWNLFWLTLGAFSGLCTLGCIFFFGAMVVLLIMGYPLVGITMITIGAGLSSGAILLFCFSLLKKSDKGDNGTIKKNYGTKDSHIEESEERENDWEYPKEIESKEKRITVINSCEEVLNHA